jgi:ankyrin repeat protein
MVQRLSGSKSENPTKRLNLEKQKISTEKIAISPEKQEQLNGMLVNAAYHGNIKRVERLLKAGAYADARNSNEATALMLAAEGGYAEIAKLLVDAGADVNAKDKKGWRALIGAATKGYFEICELLIKKGAEIDAKVEKEFYKGRTALIWAARNGHVKTCALLIENGANMDMIDDNGRSALMLAFSNGKGRTAKFLRSMEYLRQWTGEGNFKSFLSNIRECAQ